MDSLLDHGSFDGCNVEEEFETFLECGLGVIDQIFVSEDVEGDLLGHFTDDVVMVKLNVLGHCSHPLGPPLWELFVQLLVWHEGVTSGVDEVCEGRDDVEGVAHDTEHLLGVEDNFVALLQWVVCFRYPNTVVIECVFLTKKAHHGLVEGVLDVHVGTGVDARDLLDKPP